MTPKFTSAVDFLHIPCHNFVTPTSDQPPAGPKVGELWTDTSKEPAELKFWNGSGQWVKIG